MSETSIRLSVVNDRGVINLRGDPADQAFLTASEAVLGQALPVMSNTISEAGHRIYWLGPDEWLIVTAAAGAKELRQRLDGQLTDLHVAVNDVSGGSTVLQLSGAAVRDLLARGSTLDLHARVFTPGSCAQSGLGKASVLLGLLGDGETFELIVRRSFADYLLKWLSRMASPFGIEFG